MDKISEIEFNEMMEDIFDTEQERAEYELYTKELLHKQNMLLLEGIKGVMALSKDDIVHSYISQLIKEYHEIR